MSGKTEYIVAGKSITAGGNVHSKGKVVTAESLKLSDKAFNNLKKKELIIERPVKEEAAPPAPPAGGGSAPKTFRERITAALTGGKFLKRPEIIADAIATLYDKDGNPINKEDFIASGEPSVDALDVILKDGISGFEGGISSEERNEGFTLYQDRIKQASQ